MSNCNRRRRVAHLKTVFAMIELATLAALATYLLDTTIRRRPITMAAVCLRTFRGAGNLARPAGGDTAKLECLALTLQPKNAGRSA